jgi:hypothetical protein
MQGKSKLPLLQSLAFFQIGIQVVLYQKIIIQTKPKIKSWKIQKQPLCYLPPVSKAQV